MAKKFVLDALVKVLGEFIDINEENLNLSVAVWSGRIILKNLKLKTDKLLKNFNLSVHHGLIHQLEVVIPWTALFNSPVKILIDGVYLQFGPLSSVISSMKDRRKLSLNRKREKLRLSDKFLDFSSADGTMKDGKGKSETYIQQLTTKIIDNLEITLNNVHIRYEDSISLPNRVISAGITLQSFILVTCDDQWKVTFVARSSSTSATLNKIAEVKGFAVYWNTVSDSFVKLPFDDWVIAMTKSIAVENMATSIRNLRYILAPKNNITIKLTHRDVYTETIPKFNVTIECTNLPLSIDMAQYLQLKRVFSQVLYDDRGYGKYSCSYRPKFRPTSSKAAAKAWWIYACKAIIRKPKYIYLVKQIKLHEKNPSGSSSSPYDPLTIQQCKELEHLEERLPTHTLVLFRLAAFKEAADYKRNHTNLQSPTSSRGTVAQKSSTPSWSGWFNSSTTPDSVPLEDDVPLDRIINEFYEDDDSGRSDNQSQSSALLASVQINSSATIELLYESKAVVRSVMSLSTTVQITSLGILARADLVDFIVEDKFTPSPPLRNLISVKYRSRSRRTNDSNEKVASNDSKQPSLTVQVEYYRGKMKAKVTTLPFLFCLNKDCVQMLLAMYFYSSSKVEANEQDQLADSFQSVTADIKKPNTQSKSLTPQHSDFEVIFEAHAPKIIIPEHSSSDSGYLLLDTGYLEVKGFTGKDGMSWDISLKEINVAMPLSVKDLYTFNEKYLYLIKPFDIIVAVQTIYRLTADMVIDIDVKPELRGELDPRKLARLFHIIQAVYHTFQNLPTLNVGFFLDSPLSTNVSLANLASISRVETDEEDDGLAYGTPRASPIEFLDFSIEEPSLNPLVSSSSGQAKKVPLTPSHSTDRFSEFSELSISSEKSKKPVDSGHVKMKITCNLRKVILDLSYDVKQGHHLVLTLSNASTIVILRAFDMVVSFNLNGLAIEDSLRSEAQRYLARTPENCPLINITYTNSSSTLSPYYKNHASEVVVNFANLGLNIDVKTISHLKPFIEVLLHLRGGNQSILRPENSSSSLWSPHQNGPSINLSTIAAALSSMQKKISSANEMESIIPLERSLKALPNTVPSGMLILATIDQISLDILRPSTSGAAGETLQNAFSLQILSLRAIIDMKDLLSSDVQLKSFIIFDARDISKDYAFRTIFCPIFENKEPKSSQIDNVVDTEFDGTSLPSRSVDLLHLVYKQESSSSAFMDVKVSNTTSFVAVDTILDLSFILMDNFFAILDLLANPGPEKLSSLFHEYLSHYGVFTDMKQQNQANDMSKLSQEVLDIDSMDWSTYTLNVSVKVDNPRLLLLDDPTSDESRAIVGRCQVEIHFTRETRTCSSIQNFRDLHESLHLSVKHLEMFVIETVVNIDDFKPILEPFGLEYHVRRRLRNGVSISTHMSTDLDGIEARISIRDIMLLQSILTRRFLKSANASTGIKAAPQSLTDSASTIVTADVASSSDQSNNFSISITAGTISVVAIDDYGGKNIPFLHATLENTTFFSEGNLPVHLCGEGSFVTQADFYNSKLDSWEPVLETCKPVILATVEEGNAVIELKSAHTLQLTVSGYFVHKLLETYFLLMNRAKSKNLAISAQESSSLSITNCLGEHVDIDLLDSKNRKLVFFLTGNGDQSKASVVKSREYINRSTYLDNWANPIELPAAVDLHFRGLLEGKRKPVLHVPFNISKPRLYNLIPMNVTEHVDTSSGQSKSKRIIILEPIVEETYENARYEPITGMWRKPFLFGDPDEWTDATLTNSRHPQSISIKDDKWEWQDSWTVDMVGTVGKDFDGEGWEYSNSFKSFSIASKRRANLPMDCVRRRRWVRTRVPKASAENENARPLNIFWDVRVDNSGNREVKIRSGLIIKNSMPFSVNIFLFHKTWETDEVKFGPINPSDELSVPLIRSFATSLKIQPISDFVSYDLSHSLSCNIQQFDFQSVKDIYCDAHPSDNNNKQLASVVIRVSLNQTNKCLFVDLLPYITIMNILPCDLKYRVSSSDKKRESGVLLCGSSTKLIHVDTSLAPVISLKLGNYNWSQPCKIELPAENKLTLITAELSRKLSAWTNRSDKANDSNMDEDTSKLKLTISVKASQGGRFDIAIFSKSAVIDRTGLGLSIWCNINNSMATIIRTYGTDSTNMLSAFTDHASDSHIQRLDEIDKNIEIGSDNVIKPSRSNDQIIGNVASDLFEHQFRQPWNPASNLDSQKRSQIVYNLDETKTIELVKDLNVKSSFAYGVTNLKDGGHVYTDRKLRWSYLPPVIMLGGTSISVQTAHHDYMHRLRDMIKFRLVAPAIVFLLIDRKIESCPKWIEDNGYEITNQHAVARCVENGKLVEVFYTIYGKHFDLTNSGEEWIYLHGNWSREHGNMYSLIITPDPRHLKPLPQISDSVLKHMEIEFMSVLEQLYFNSRYDRAIVGKAWVDGGLGLGLFHSHNDIVSVGILQDKIWSNGININTANGAPSHGYFEIVDWTTNREFQLSYRIEQMPGLFRNTQCLTVMPRYCIVNCMDEPIMIAQRGGPASHKGFVVKPYHVEPWHKIDSSSYNILHFRTQSTAWSHGVIDINEVGSSVLYLPRRSAMKKVTNQLDSSNVVVRPPLPVDNVRKEPYVIHVEVKEADRSENCSVVVIIWRASVLGHNAALSIKNDSDVPVTVAQSDVYVSGDGYEASLFEIIVSPNQWIPFGWADPDAGSNISIVVGESLRGQNSRRVATVSFLKTGELLRLPDHSGRLGNAGEVLLSIIPEGNGRILRIARMTNLPRLDIESEGKGSLTHITQLPSFTFKIHFASCGLSLVLDKPIRREFMSLYLDGLDISLRQTGKIRSLEVNVMDMQIDNYSESKIYPVLLRSKKKEIHRSITMSGESSIEAEGSHDEEQASKEIPLIVMSVIQEFPVDQISAPMFRYIAFRLLPIYLEVDSASIQILFADLINDFKLLSTSQILATMNPVSWVEEYNKSLVSPFNRLFILDMYHSKIMSQRSKMYFQKLVVHPVKLFVTIIPTPDYNHDTDHDTIQSTFSNVFKSLAAIDRVQLKLRSFEVEDAMETKSSLLYLIVSQFRQDISSHFGQLFGSLAVIGSPMGFARKVGRGVKAFFYEPYLGLVQSPQDFVLGIGKGTSSLVSGVVSGAMSSTVAIVGTAAKGISYLSGDSEYIRKRAIKREMHRTTRRGIVEGFFDGGESLLSGLASGVTGLVTKPLEEARRGGAVGFFRGIGLGLVGAAVKPVMGFTDGIASVANGISNSVGENTDCDHVRPARAFDRSSSDTSDLIIRPLRLEAAFAQEFVLLRAKHNSYQDAFLTYIPMSESPDSAVILSEVYVYWRKPKSLWGRTWSNISHVVCFLNEVGIMMYGAVGKNKAEAFSIQCTSQAKVLEVYSALAYNAHRMGNPTLVIPADLVEQYGLNQAMNSIDLRKISRPGHSTNLAGELDGYRFGQANSVTLPRITGPEIDVLRRCEHYLKEECPSVKVLDERLWRLIWEWECTHTGLTASRCCVTLFINRSDTPIQIGKIQIIHGRNVLIIGSAANEYEEESRCIQPDGLVTIFIWAFSPTPIEVGHLKAVINTAEFVATVASTQRESSCVSQGGLSVAFLEKSVAEWWSKYVVLIEN